MTAWSTENWEKFTRTGQKRSSPGSTRPESTAGPRSREPDRMAHRDACVFRQIQMRSIPDVIHSTMDVTVVTNALWWYCAY
ncbi:hypothetical protein H920_00092 [Fukomys damarensis]|uniref:Uncharacterized protein n=1 Tax=Fukomys damarensis TaxID=885580 RepID=A0A091E6N9_FUKDA|nr:hypothetical protein H920_00092 [Fukomys damarensis]